MRPSIFMPTNCQHDHVTCGCGNVNSGMDKNVERSQEKSARKAAPAKAKAVRCSGDSLYPVFDITEFDCISIRRISASFQYNCAKNGKGLKIGTKKADTT